MDVDQSNDLFSDVIDDEEVEELTAEEVLKKLEEAWRNEKNAPELLEPKMEIVECMLEQVSTMEQNLESLAIGDIRIFVHRMELSRIKFVINSYLRTRLDKIQNNFYFYSQEEGKVNQDNPSKLSTEEADFLAKYEQCVGDLFHGLCLRHLPGTFDMEKIQMKPAQPNLQAAVFVQVDKDVRGLEIRDTAGSGRDETLDLMAGEQHLLQYAAVSHLLDSATVRLV